MSEHSRWNDMTLKRIVSLWPIIAAGVMLVGAYFMKSATLDATATLAKQTASEVIAVKTEQAVQREMIAAVREDQSEMKRDIKQILRAVK